MARLTGQLIVVEARQEPSNRIGGQLIVVEAQGQSTHFMSGQLMVVEVFPTRVLTPGAGGSVNLTTGHNLSPHELIVSPSFTGFRLKRPGGE